MEKNYQLKPFLLLFVLLKVGLNLFAISHFGFHGDELLHMALGNHLAWGFKEVPPFIALIAKISAVLFGDSVAAIRIFPTIAGGLIIWFTGLITLELGGRKFAITLACITLIISPAFAASDYLFQPVIFDQLWWVISVWLLLKNINTTQHKYLYWLGLVVGIGLLTKYTMAFFTFSLLAALLVSKQRKMLWNKHILASFLIAFLIFLPNVLWQFQHHLPVFTHMKMLRKEQLDFISHGQFIKEQLSVNGIALFVWLAGLLFLLIDKHLQKFRFLAFAYFFIFMFLLEMHGKSYYLFGAYPMLFAAGGFAFERMIRAYHPLLRTTTVAVFTIPNLVLLPIVLPILPIEQTETTIRYVMQKVPSLQFAITWEDHKQHPLTQDYAYMLGWEEMVEKTSKIYQHLSAIQQKNTAILADNYAEAGAFEHFGPKYNLPQVVCLNSSFALWAPETLKQQNIIYISDDKDVSDLLQVVGSAELLNTITNPLSREFDTGIFLLKDTKSGLNTIYQQHLALTRQH